MIPHSVFTITGLHTTEDSFNLLKHQYNVLEEKCKKLTIYLNTKWRTIKTKNGNKHLLLFLSEAHMKMYHKGLVDHLAWIHIQG